MLSYFILFSRFDQRTDSAAEDTELMPNPQSQLSTTLQACQRATAYPSEHPEENDTPNATKVH